MGERQREKLFKQKEYWRNKQDILIITMIINISTLFFLSLRTILSVRHITEPTCPSPRPFLDIKHTEWPKPWKSLFIPAAYSPQKKPRTEWYKNYNRNFSRGLRSGGKGKGNYGNKGRKRVEELERGKREREQGRGKISLALLFVPTAFFDTVVFLFCFHSEW